MVDAYLALVSKRDNHDPIALGQDQVGLASVRALELGHQGEQGFREYRHGDSKPRAPLARAESRAGSGMGDPLTPLRTA